ncbi:type II secretion system F family protein [Patescibacteria group bacterium]|nr:type II secretion system F family protein [Patescibacteria group bacterium]
MEPKVNTKQQLAKPQVVTKNKAINKADSVQDQNMDKQELPELLMPEKKKVSLMTKMNIRLSGKEKVLFAKYLSVLLDSGLPLKEAIDILLEQSKGSLKKIITKLMSEIENGNTLADGLSNFPHIFSHVFISLVRAGEASGTMKANLLYLSEQLQKQYDLKKSIQGAMMYPALIFFGGLAVSIVIVVFVLPGVLSLFKTMNVELPFTTKVLIWFAEFTQNYPIQLIVGGVSLAVGIVLARSIPIFKNLTDALMLHIPVAGNIIKNSILANSFRLMGTLIQSGVRVQNALEITLDTMNYKPYKVLFTELKTEVNQGHGMTQTLEKYKKLIPSLAMRLIHVGSETGTLEKSFLYLADFYEKEVDESSKRVATLMEPLLIICIGIMVAFLAFSIISPIYGVVANVG